MFFAGAILAGCASRQPFTMTCTAIGATVVDSGERIELESFSVTAPKGKRWCLAFRNRAQVVFWTHALMGQYIEKPNARIAQNTIAMVAQRVKHGTSRLKEANELQRFVEEWVARGFAVNSSGSGSIVGDAVDPRFTMLRSNVRQERVSNADCVLYEYDSEERDNPRAPNKVLIMNARGVICSHTTDPDYLVVTQFSERYPRGEQIDPTLFGSLDRQYAEPFFRSLTFPRAE